MVVPIFGSWSLAGRCHRCRSSIEPPLLLSAGSLHLSTAGCWQLWSSIGQWRMGRVLNPAGRALTSAAQATCTSIVDLPDDGGAPGALTLVWIVCVPLESPRSRTPTP